MNIRPVLKERIQEAQSHDPKLVEIIENVKQGKYINFNLHDDVLMYGDRICVPDVDNLRREILDETHNAPYAMHPRATKMYLTMKSYYWCPRMKKEVIEFTTKYLTCQQVKT